jgi:hypothetical protein
MCEIMWDLKEPFPLRASFRSFHHFNKGRFLFPDMVGNKREVWNQKFFFRLITQIIDYHTCKKFMNCWRILESPIKMKWSPERLKVLLLREASKWFRVLSCWCRTSKQATDRSTVYCNSRHEFWCCFLEMKYNIFFDTCAHLE